jgi:hypothetical protein
MKLQKQVPVPKIEIDLSRIQQLSQERDDEKLGIPIMAKTVRSR